MRRVRRLDFQRIGKITRTPAGGIVITGAVTRAGCFEYKTADGATVVEYRPTAEVFKIDSMRSLNNATITIGHPPEMVTPKTYREVVRGHIIAGSVKRDGDHVVADHAIDDAECIRRIDAGALVEESCGYRCDLDETPGVVPEGEPDAGKRYDRKQTNIEYNHVALGAEGWGRGGNSVSLRLDSNGNVCFNQNVERARPPRKIRTMKLPKIEIVGKRTIRIDGVNYSLGSSAGRAQAKAVIAQVKQRIDAEIATLRKDDAESEENSALKSISDALMAMVQQVHDMMARQSVEAEQTQTPAEGEPVDENKDADDEKKPVDENKDADDEKKPTLDSLVEERAAIVEKARKLDSKLDTRGKSNVQIMRAALKSARIDGVDDFNDAEVRGAFAVVPVRTSHPTLRKLNDATTGRGRRDSSDEDAEDERMDGAAAQKAHHAHYANAWKTKR